MKQLTLYYYTWQYVIQSFLIKELMRTTHLVQMNLLWSKVLKI